MTTPTLHAGQPVLTAGAPLGQGQAVMILLHGRGASPESILGLVPSLDTAGFTYLAPTAANNTWYPHRFIADLASNEPWLSSALAIVGEIVREAGDHGIRPAQIMLLGFSQGACLSGEFAVRHADRYGGIVMLSGGLIGPPGTKWDYAGSLAGTPAFLGCSDADAHIPMARVEESAHVLERMGALVTTRFYPGMGHTVNQDEVGVIRSMMNRVLPGAAAGDRN